MDCERARELILTDDLDGEATPADKRDLLTHLVACEGCRALKEQAGPALVVPFAGLTSPTPPPELWQRVATRLESEGTEEPTSGPTESSGPLARLLEFLTRGWRTTLAGGFALALLVLMLTNPWSISPPPPFAADSPAAQVFLLFEDDPQDRPVDSILAGDPTLHSPLEEVFF